MEEPLLSVCLITYNHVKYIRQAIEGVLMQKVNFTWELIIADDFSADGTREIILEYKDKYPVFIKLILQKQNVGPAKNWIDLISSPKSKYIAYFEGDDFWTDPYKLQKQVNFLEANSDFSLCFHNAVIKWDDNSKPNSYFCPKDQKPVTSIEDVIKGWFIPSASMVFKRNAIMPLPEWFSCVYNGDWALQMLAASKGKIGYLNDLMSVYRKSPNSLSYTSGGDVIFINNQRINLLNRLNSYTNQKFQKHIKIAILKLNKECIDYYFKKHYKLIYWAFHPKKWSEKVFNKYRKI